MHQISNISEKYFYIILFSVIGVDRFFLYMVKSKLLTQKSIYFVMEAVVFKFWPNVIYKQHVFW
jgi:hypothetical protein